MSSRRAGLLELSAPYVKLLCTMAWFLPLTSLLYSHNEGPFLLFSGSTLFHLKRNSLIALKADYYMNARSVKKLSLNLLQVLGTYRFGLWFLDWSTHLLGLTENLSK